MSTSSNPYQPPVISTDPNTPSISLPRRILHGYGLGIWSIAYFYPLWLLGSFYFTWLIAWIELGHPPRPSLDDPALIGGMTSIAYFLPGVLLLLSPVLAPVGLVSSLFYPFSLQSVRSRLPWIGMLTGFYVILCVMSFLILRSDPWRVVEWWFD